MKKFKLFFLGMLMFVALFSLHSQEPSTKTLADTTQTPINETLEITENTTFDNINYFLYTNDDYCFKIQNNATVTFNNCEFVSDTNNQILLNCLFYVSEGSKLILNDSTFEDMYVTTGICNYGIIELSNTTFNGTYKSCTIENNSSETNSIIFHSGKVSKIILNSGYISINASTIITGTIKVSLPIHNGIYGKLVVKGMGDNVFASKLLNSFSLQNATDGYYLDYVGDDCTANIQIDSETIETIETGDIILSTQNIYLKNGNLFTGMYCSANKYLTNNLANETNDLYVKNSLALNNYTAHTESSKYALDNNYNDTKVHLNITSFYDGDSTPISTSEYTYLSKSNHAVFIDIPSGYMFSKVEYIINGEEDTTILQVSENKYSNGIYMRPIIEYISNEYLEIEATINFIFTEIPKEANMTINKSDKIAVTQSSKISNTDCTFTLSPDGTVKIIDVYFNGTKMTLTQTSNTYSFSALLNETNTLTINSLNLPISVFVTPDNYSFTYGDNIVMQKTIKVEETQEEIIVNFVPSNLNAGVHTITTVECSNDDYDVQLTEGEYTYTINQKIISINEITLKPYELTYSEDMEIKAEFFIESKPDYFTVTCNLANFLPKAGEQFIQLVASPSDDNHVLEDSEHNIIYATLVINPAPLNTSDYSFETNFSIYYDKSAHMPKLLNVDIDAVNIDYSISLLNDNTSTPIEEAINAGTYYIEAKFSSKSSLHATNLILSTTFEILPVTLDISTFKQETQSQTFTYSKTPYYITTNSELLPTEVSITNTTNNDGHINAGTYVVEVYLSYDKVNYMCEDVIECSLIIVPKEISISLETNTFTYSGTTPQLKAIPNGIIGEDIVSITLADNVQFNVGEYTIDITGISNNNYTYTISTLAYNITTASVDMSNTTLEKLNITYDGQYHKPIFSGILPTGITYSFDTTTGYKNAGEYIVTCSFENSNDNYTTPAPMTTTLTINPKPIRVIFTPPTNLLANNEMKVCLVEFADTINGEIPVHEISYSGDTSVPGIHTCFVHLPKDSNYVIINANKFDFTVLAKNVSFKNKDINVTLEGEFNPLVELTVTKTTNNPDIINIMSNQEYEQYSAYSLEFDDFTAKSVKVSIVAESIISNINYLKIYKLEDGKLININYTISGNNIVFELSDDEQLIFVQEKTNVKNNINIIIIIISLAVLALTTFAILMAIHKKKVKKKRVLK